MKRLFYFALVSTLILVACGDDESSNPFVPSEDSSSSFAGISSSLSSSATFVTLSSSTPIEGLSSSSRKDSVGSLSSAKGKSSSSVVESSSNGDSGSMTGMTSSSYVNSISSSSVQNEKSSSSEKNDAVTGTMMDERDGQTYKIVKIGRLWWFAQNLNFDTENSHCFRDSSKYCAKYGRLYTWAAAVGKSEEECGYRQECNLLLPVQGACPSGWRVPSNYDWNDLLVSVGGDDIAGEVLRDSKEGGFALVYAGRINYAGDFIELEESARIWSSSEVDEDDAFYAEFYYTLEDVWFPEEGSKYEGYSVRCVKGEL